MILYPSFFLLVLSQAAFATSVQMLQLRGLEILESRQSGCPICTTVSQTLSTCAASGASAIALRCACSATINAQVQACVDCGVSGKVPDSTVQSLIDSYSQLCKSSPTITKPGGSGATSVPKASSGTSDKGRRAGVAAIGAIVGAALVVVQELILLP